MNARRSDIALAVQSLWELARFLALVLLLVLRFATALREDPQAILWLLAAGSTQLALPAGLLLLFLKPRDLAPLIGLLRVGKILQVFMGLILLFALPFGRGLPHLPLGFLPARFSALPVLLAMGLVDIAFLFLLFSWRPPTEKALPQPRFTETVLPPEDHP